MISHSSVLTTVAQQQLCGLTIWGRGAVAPAGRGTVMHTASAIPKDAKQTTGALWFPNVDQNPRKYALQCLIFMMHPDIGDASSTFCPASPI